MSLVSSPVRSVPIALHGAVCLSGCPHTVTRNRGQGGHGWMGRESADGSGWAAQGAGAGQWGGAAGGAQQGLGLGLGIGGREKKDKSRDHRRNETSPEAASTN